MDLRSLNTFIQVAELGSFTKAGEKLGYSQPTVSFQIKQLERELEVQLFDRIGHTVCLTDDGREALSYAQSICRLSEEMAQGAKNRYEPSGMVRIDLGQSLCGPLIVNGLKGFRDLYPKVSIKIHTSGTDEMIERLDHNETDMVVTLDSHIWSGAYVVAHEQRVDTHFICAADHPFARRADPIRPEELLEQPFLLTEKGMGYRRLMDERLAAMNMEVVPVLEFGDADTVCKLVEQGVGISFLPGYVTADALRRGTIRRFSVEGVDIDLWVQLLYHRDKWMPTQMQALINYLSDIVLEN